MQFDCRKHFYFKLFSLVKEFLFKKFIIAFVYTQINVKTVLIQVIQFSISTQFCSI